MLTASLFLRLVAAGSPGEPTIPQLHEKLLAQGARIEELQATVGKQSAQLSEQQAQFGQQKAELDEQKAQLEELRELVRRRGAAAPAPSKTVKFGVDGSGTGRALSEFTASSSIGTHAWQSHVFPDGNSCQNLDTGRPMKLLPVKSDGSLSWSASPSNLPADFNVSLVSVQSNWTTSEVNAYHRLRFTDRALCAASSHPDPPCRLTGSRTPSRSSITSTAVSRPRSSCPCTPPSAEP